MPAYTVEIEDTPENRAFLNSLKAQGGKPVYPKEIQAAIDAGLQPMKGELNGIPVLFFGITDQGHIVGKKGQ
jgi:hypothetical protein